MAKNSEKRVATARMKELLDLAVIDDREGNFQRANRKYELIFLYSTKYKTRVIKDVKSWVCKKCKTGIYSGGGHIRLNKSRVTIKCGNCGYVRRVPMIPREFQR